MRASRGESARVALPGKRARDDDHLIGAQRARLLHYARRMPDDSEPRNDLRPGPLVVVQEPHHLGPVVRGIVQLLGDRHSLLIRAGNQHPANQNALPPPAQRELAPRQP